MFGNTIITMLEFAHNNVDNLFAKELQTIFYLVTLHPSRFSVFVKTGSENYMLGKVNFPIQEVDQLTIVVLFCPMPMSLCNLSNNFRKVVMDVFLGSTHTLRIPALWQVPKKRPSLRGSKVTSPTSSLPV